MSPGTPHCWVSWPCTHQVPVAGRQMATSARPSPLKSACETPFAPCAAAADGPLSETLLPSDGHDQNSTDPLTTLAHSASAAARSAPRIPPNHMLPDSKPASTTRFKRPVVPNVTALPGHADHPG